MVDKILIIFFAFFLTSRFFTEKLQILPKFIDIIDIPIILLLGLFALTRVINKHVNAIDDKYITLCLITCALTIAFSSLFNLNNLLVPAVILFTIGFLEGPLLFFILNRVITDTSDFSQKIRKLFYSLLIVNFLVVVLIDFPSFAISGNPDEISGTYGFNCYYYSVFLVICGGLLFGDCVFNKRTKTIFIGGQGFVFLTFFLLQYRAALPFFLLSYIALLFLYYGRKRMSGFVIVCFALTVLGFMSITMSKFQFEAASKLKYDKWVDIINNPTEMLKYGKFQAYPRTFDMMGGNLKSLLLGIGPGNFLSRAYNTFSYEMRRTDKGVGKIAKNYLNIYSPRYTYEDLRYLSVYRGHAIYGSYQPSNPNSSFLAPTAEIGLIGGCIIIFLYIYLIKRSFELFKIARDCVPEYLPIASALITGAVYLFCLGFLDNYWEMSRATLPVWLLFWAVSAGIEGCLKGRHPQVVHKNCIQ